MANNLSATNLDSTLDTQTFFNNFYKPTFDVSQNIDDAIVGFFEKITDGKDSAKLLASAVIYTSLTQNIDPMDTLAQFTKLPRADVANYLTMFLNLNRVGTSYLGISNKPGVSKYVARMILP